MSARALPDPFGDLVERYGLADVWEHPSLDPHAKSIVALTVCAVAGTDDELARCITDATNSGVTKPEIAEIFLQLAVLVGLPVARQAFTVAEQVLMAEERTGVVEASTPDKGRAESEDTGTPGERSELA
jgi:alkylhydroperoxidase/carboxymuconolactone decarboxylase family protein YurZ